MGAGRSKRALIAVGPAATPHLLKSVRSTHDTINDPAVRILCDPKMWDAAAVQDPAALPFLGQLLVHVSIDRRARETTLKAFSQLGAKADAAIPRLVAMFSEPREDLREFARSVLISIDANWQKNPQINAAIPDVLPWLTELPEAESKELFAAFGDLPAIEGDRLVKMLCTIPEWPTEERKQREHGLRYGQGMKGGSSGDLKKRLEYDQKRDQEAYRERMFVALERLGPRVSSAAPAFAKMLEDRNADILSRLRLIRSLKFILTDLSPVLPAVLKVLGNGPEAQAFLKEHGEAALQHIDKLLSDPNAGARVQGVRLAAPFRERAKPMLSKIIACLRDEGWTGAAGNEVPSRDYILSVLPTIDPDWAKHPLAMRVLGDVLASGKRLDKTLTELGPIAKPLAPHLIRLLLDLRKPGFDESARDTLDHIDPKWRESQAAKEVAIELITRLEKNAPGDYIGRGLTELAPVAGPEFCKILPGAPEEKRNRIFAILREAGGRAMPAVPDLIELLVAPDARLAYLVVDVLPAIEPNWAERPRVKELASKVVANQIAVPDGTAGFAKICGFLGPVVVPDLVQLVEGGDTAKRKAALGGLRWIARGAKAATPAVVKAATDKDIDVRQLALQTLARIAVGEKDVVTALLVELPTNLNKDALEALEAVDPDWRRGKQLKAGLPSIFKQLTEKDDRRRRYAVVALRQIGPAEGVIAAARNVAISFTQRSRNPLDVAPDFLTHWRDTIPLYSHKTRTGCLP